MLSTDIGAGPFCWCPAKNNSASLGLHKGPNRARIERTTHPNAGHGMDPTRDAPMLRRGRNPRLLSGIPFSIFGIWDPTGISLSPKKIYFFPGLTQQPRATSSFWQSFGFRVMQCSAHGTCRNQEL